MFKVIVAGGRDFDDYDLLDRKLHNLLVNKMDQLIIVSGMARGADSLAVRWAEENGIKVEKYPADWKAHGKRAGWVRNCQMADVSDALIAFWDGESRGTKMMIDIMNDRWLPVRVVRYERKSE